jgi:hypothetical protein
VNKEKSAIDSARQASQWQQSKLLSLPLSVQALARHERAILVHAAGVDEDGQPVF